MGAVKILGVPCWALPLAAGTVWLVTLLLMIIMWAAKGSDRYPEMYTKQEWPFISNTGATPWGKPIFITGSSIMATLLCGTVALERWLSRGGDRLINHKTKATSGLFISSATSTAIGSIALILLTLCDVRNHANIHYPLVGIFLFGYLFSAIFACAERKLISRHYPSNKIIRFCFRTKLVFVLVEISLVCIFAATLYQQVYGVSVIVEWIAAFFLVFYMWTFSFDFYSKTKKHKGHVMTRRRPLDEERIDSVTRPGRVRFATNDYVELP